MNQNAYITECIYHMMHNICKERGRERESACVCVMYTLYWDHEPQVFLIPLSIGYTCQMFKRHFNEKLNGTERPCDWSMMTMMTIMTMLYYMRISSKIYGTHRYPQFAYIFIVLMLCHRDTANNNSKCLFVYPYPQHIRMRVRVCVSIMCRYSFCYHFPYPSHVLM